MSGQPIPHISTATGGDRAARIARLQDLIERDGAGAAHGLPNVFHHALGAGAMREVDDETLVLVTFVTATGYSHAFALDRAVADGLREALRVPSPLITRPAATGRRPLRKPSGRLL